MPPPPLLPLLKQLWRTTLLGLVAAFPPSPLARRRRAACGSASASQLAVALLPLHPRAEYLPQSGAYAEAEALRKILKPDSALVEGSSLDRADKEAL